MARRKGSTATSPAALIVDELRDAGMTVEHIAHAVGVHPHTVTAWGRGFGAEPYSMRRLRDLHSHLVAWHVVAKAAT